MTPCLKCILQCQDTKPLRQTFQPTAVKFSGSQTLSCYLRLVKMWCSSFTREEHGYPSPLATLPSQPETWKVQAFCESSQHIDPTSKWAIRQWIESRTALSCCLHCSFSSCHWHTQQCWFCQQLQNRWQSVTVNCNQGISRGHKTLLPPWLLMMRMLLV